MPLGISFNIFGKLALLISQVRSYQNSQNTNLTDTTSGVVAQFNGEPDVQALVGSAYIGQLNAPGTIGGLAQNVARTALNRKIFRDNPRISQTLQSLNVLDSITELIRQMKLAGATVLAQTIAATPTAFTGTGNGVIVASTRRALDGLVLENAFAETLLLVVANDSYTGGATAGNEGINVTGTGQQTNVFAFDWPLGSNASTGLQVIDGNVDNGSGNILTNSGFEAFSNNVPSNWTLVVGAGGTDIFDENSIVYDPVSGGSAIRLTGVAGGTLTQIRQQFNASAGTLGELDPLQQYSFNVFVRRDGTAAAAGVLTVELVDNNFNVLQDENGANNTFTIDLTALTTSYVAYNGVFRTPAVMPSAVYLRLRLSTALTSGRSVYLDKGSLGQMTQTVTGGIFLAVHAGSNKFVAGDYATVAVTNSRGAGGTLNTFQTAIYRLIPEFASNELILPSSATPTISDGLI